MAAGIVIRHRKTDPGRWRCITGGVLTDGEGRTSIDGSGCGEVT
jgi:hypothetical protein